MQFTELIESKLLLSFMKKAADALATTRALKSTVQCTRTLVELAVFLAFAH